MTEMTKGRVLRFGAYSIMPGGPDEPSVFGHVTRPGLRASWFITAGPNGPVLAAGQTWTKAGAWAAAITAAHHAETLVQLRAVRGAR